MTDREKLEERLKQVPDTYDDLVKGVSIFAERDGYAKDMLKMLEEHPEATSDDVLEYEYEICVERGIPMDDVGTEPEDDDE